MLPTYRQPIKDDAGECVNFIPQIDGTLAPIEANKNAVIVQIMGYGKKIVSIECMNEDFYPLLQEEAKRILGL